MHAFLKTLAVAAGLALSAGQASAFCGFFVAKGDAKLFNDASKVVMVRDGNRTVLTMVNDFRGDVKDFAMVIPAPTVLQEEQIHVTENAIVEHLDAYTAPRLVEYFDPDPCQQRVYREDTVALSAAPVQEAEAPAGRAKSLGVTIEAEYTVGEYDILILSAKESDGLTVWLTENDYRIPDGAGPVLGSYIKQGMKFFVAKVNLEEHASSGNTFLRPLQIAFESEKFMLPIRLGTLNAQGKQDLLLWTLTRKGRVETANYRVQRMPTGDEIPTYVKADFGPAYKAIYGTAVERAGGAGVLMEYAWDMGWCDPCAADPLSNQELRALGVFWVDGGYQTVLARKGDTVGTIARRMGLNASELAAFNAMPVDRRLSEGAELRLPPPPGQRIAPQQAPDVFVTRLHARYDAESFPEDLRLVETGDRTNFQGRYVMRHPWRGSAQCEAAKDYRATLPARFEREAQTLANLTGWDIEEIRLAMAEAGTKPGQSQPWWKGLWD